MLFLIPLSMMVFVISDLTYISVTQYGDLNNHSSHIKDLVCSNPDEISPCTCIETSGKLELVCKGISDEQQLHDIFHGNFPTKQFEKLEIETYLFDNLSDDVFGEVMFKSVFTPNYGMGRLTSVGPGTFMKMAPELNILSLGYSNITSFPFETLSSYPKLWAFSLRESPLPSFPIIQSESLTVLDLSHGKYEEIPEGAFDGMPNLEYVFVSSYKPFSIAKGVFSSLHKLKGIEIVMSEGFDHISSYTFQVDSSELEKIRLDHNGIKSVEVDAFKGVQAGTTIDMTGNSLRTLPEATWRPLLEAGVKLDFSENWLECGCDMAWLVVGTGYHHLVSFECNGRSLSNDDISWYSENC